MDGEQLGFHIYLCVSIHNKMMNIVEHSRQQCIYLKLWGILYEKRYLDIKPTFRIDPCESRYDPFQWSRMKRKRKR